MTENTVDYERVVNDEIVVLGGGTVSPVRNHLALCAPAYGTTAKYLAERLNARCILTKMADSSSNIQTNEDVGRLIDSLLANESVKVIVMNMALCDYYVEGGDFHGDRYVTSEGGITLDLVPAPKILDKIRRVRPDIFLVGFKTTTNKTKEEQFEIALKMMKRSKCNLVFANDTVTRSNMVLTPEESYYAFSDRDTTLEFLVATILNRYKGTYKRTKHTIVPGYQLDTMPDTFVQVVRHLIESGGFIINNGNGFSPGHFCWKPNGNWKYQVSGLDSDDFFLCSMRKTDHNKVFVEGMCLVEFVDDNIKVYGPRKASVGATSQKLLFDKYPQMDCIVHVHCPPNEDSDMRNRWAEQWPYQCGSLECGMNTADNMQRYEHMGVEFFAVYLKKHGPVIMFNSSYRPDVVKSFIDRHVMLGVKTV